MLSAKFTKFPCWALCYVVNGDSDCLNQNEIDQINKSCDNIKKSLGAKWVDICPNFDEYGNLKDYFCPTPMFGLACECCDVTVIYEKSDEQEDY